MKKSVIATSHYRVVITAIIVYALVVPIFFELENALGVKNFVDDTDTDKMTHSQQTIETHCKSPCPSSAEMCIAMCA
ncbi:MAG TPA: hypothetical protein VFV86_01060 [Nitrososphaeraceae archaeon]|nr:hypothetical protein [Nitrososphaeraceae archaeon]